MSSTTYWLCLALMWAGGACIGWAIGFKAGRAKESKQ